MVRRNRQSQPRCGHRTCDNPRAISRAFCRACWAYVSHGVRARIERATVRSDAHALTEALIEANHEISHRRGEGRPVPAPPRLDPREAYARNAVLMGEHEEIGGGE